MELNLLVILFTDTELPGKFLNKNAPLINRFLKLKPRSCFSGDAEETDNSQCPHNPFWSLFFMLVSYIVTYSVPVLFLSWSLQAEKGA